MAYARFLAFCVGGALLWVIGLVSLGYWFGNATWVKSHFGIVTLAIIALSLTPLAIEFWRHKRSARRR